MHSLILVVGQSVDRQMHRFADYRKVDPYKVYLNEEEITRIVSHYSLESRDFEFISKVYKDWSGDEAHIDEVGIHYISRSNPDGKFDWFEKGGRFSGYLKLKEERKPNFLGKILGKKATKSVSVATKSEVCDSTFQGGPPAGILWEGSWSECPIVNDASLQAKWNQDFKDIYGSLPANAKLTVVDIHG